MNDDIERQGPVTTTECPWCGGEVELRDRSDSLACGSCHIVVAIAPDGGAGTADRRTPAIGAAA